MLFAVLLQHTRSPDCVASMGTTSWPSGSVTDAWAAKAANSKAAKAAKEPPRRKRARPTLDMGPPLLVPGVVAAFRAGGSPFLRGRLAKAEPPRPRRRHYPYWRGISAVE